MEKHKIYDENTLLKWQRVFAAIVISCFICLIPLAHWKALLAVPMIFFSAADGYAGGERRLLEQGRSPPGMR